MLILDDKTYLYGNENLKECPNIHGSTGFHTEIKAVYINFVGQFCLVVMFRVMALKGFSYQAIIGWVFYMKI